MPLRLLAAFALLAGAAPAFADSPGEPEFRRWAVGYDSGVSARYHVTENWGIGGRISPSWSDDSSTGQDFSTLSNGQETSDQRYFDDDDYLRTGISASLMIFRQTRFGRWLAVGPYAEIGYSWTRTQVLDTRTRLDSEPGEISWDGRESDSRIYTVGLDFGVRPVFLISERFALESQLGFRVEHLTKKYSWLDERRSGEIDDLRITRYGSRSEDDDWSFLIVGERLGLGALLAFHVYL